MRFSADDKVAHAHQWWKEGDHPEDTVDEVDGTAKGRFVKPFAGTTTRPFNQIHEDCGAAWGAHGRITGIREPVCPGSWVVEHKDGTITVERPNLYGLSYDPVGTDWTERPVEFVADCREHKTPKRFATVAEAAQYAHTHQDDTSHISDVYSVEVNSALVKRAASRRKAAPKAEEETVSSGN